MSERVPGGGSARRRRLAAVPRVVGLVWLLAWQAAPAPAAAQSSPLTVTIDTPTGQTVSDAAGVRVAGKVDGFGPTVDGIRVVVTREADGATVLDRAVCCNPPKTGPVPFSVTTGSLPANGAYRVTVTATGYLAVLLQVAVEPARATATFKVAAPPVAPGNVRVAIQGDRSALVTWAPAPDYPDFVGYAVYRKTSSAPFQAVAGISERMTASFLDTSLGSFSGPIQYQVGTIRQGATAQQSAWLITLSDPVSATVPPPPTTAPPPTGPEASTTTTAPGGGLQEGGAASADLGGFFSAQPQPIPLPPPAPPPTLPDTGFSELLPFGAPPSTNEPPDKVGGRSPGRSSSESASGELETEDLMGVNRRALLVPIAAGSVLCVAALHLRWLNRRLAMPAAGAGAGVVDGDGFGDGFGDAGGPDLDPIEPEADAFRPERETVGASW